MKKKLSILLTFALCLTIISTSNVEAAKKPSVTKTMKLTVGQSRTIKVNGSNIKSKKYKSSNPKIATVTKKGKVTAKKAGSCKITVTIKYKTSSKTSRKKNVKKYATKKYTCKITVKKKAVPTSTGNGSVTASASPTVKPTAKPTTQPTVIPTSSIEPTPTDNGNVTASAAPPTVKPTTEPITQPTVIPTSTIEPTSTPEILPEAPKFTVDYENGKTVEEIPDTVEYCVGENTFDNDSSNTVYQGKGETIMVNPGQKIYFRYCATETQKASQVFVLEPKSLKLESIGIATVDSPKYGYRYEIRQSDDGVKYDFYLSDKELEDTSIITNENIQSIIYKEYDEYFVTSKNYYKYVYVRLAGTGEAFASNWVLADKLKIDNEFNFDDIP